MQTPHSHDATGGHDATRGQDELRPDGFEGTITLREAVAAWGAMLVTHLAVFAGNLIDSDPEVFEFLADQAEWHDGTWSRRIDMLCDAEARAWAERNPVLGRAIRVHIESEDTFRPWQRPRPDDPIPPILVRLDPFDGTTIAAGMGTNWSVAAIFYVWSRSQSRYVLSGATIATGEGHTFEYVCRERRDAGFGESRLGGEMRTYRYNGLVRDGRVPEFPEVVRLALPPGSRPGSEDYVVFSAASGARGRELLERYPAILTETTMRTLTAGTPSIVGAVLGRVGTIIDPSPASLHDATHAVILVGACGWHAWHEETGESLDLLGIFEAYAEPDKSIKRPVPPLVLSRVLTAYVPPA